VYLVGRKGGPQAIGHKHAATSVLHCGHAPGRPSSLSATPPHAVPRSAERWSTAQHSKRQSVGTARDGMRGTAGCLGCRCFHETFRLFSVPSLLLKHLMESMDLFPRPHASKSHEYKHCRYMSRAGPTGTSSASAIKLDSSAAARNSLSRANARRSCSTSSRLPRSSSCRTSASSFESF